METMKRVFLLLITFCLAAESVAADAETLKAGKKFYEQAGSCVACHQPDGKGITPLAPPLAQSEWVTGSPKVLAAIVLHGLAGPITVNGKTYAPPDIQPLMPGLKDNTEYGDRKLAAIMTYVRNAWGNKADPVRTDFVKSVRKATADRSDVYAPEELLKMR